MTRFAAVALMAFGGVWAAAVQQAPAPQRPPTFRAGVDIVQVDVSVLDKNRRPVRGLTAADFTILEDGKPQPVVAFSPVEIPDPPAAPVVAGRTITWMRDVAPDVQTNDVASGRLFVMLVDDALIPQDPKIVANARRIAHAVIDQLGRGDRVAVVFSQQGHLAQGFTNDRQRLLAAVDRIDAGRARYTFGWDTIRDRNSFTIDTAADPDRFRNPHPHGDPDEGARDASVRTLQLVGDTLASAPQQRKGLIYISPGVTLNMANVGHGDLAAGRTQDVRESNVRLGDLLPDTFRRLQAANVVIYSIDPAGPRGLFEFVSRAINVIPQMHQYTADIVDRSTGEARPEKSLAPCDNAPTAADMRSGGAKPPCYVPGADDLANFVAGLNSDFLQTVSANTGGRAIVGNERFEDAVAQIFVENSAYYMLAYRTPPGNKPGTMHRLKVTVDKPGVEVRTRSAYYTPDAERATAKDATMSPTKKAIIGLLPSPNLPLEVALAPVAIPGSDGAAVTIALGLQRTSAAVAISDTVEVETRAFTPEGQPKGIQQQEARIAVRPNGMGDVARYEALSSIALKPGRYQLRIGVYSATNDAAGSVFADVDVPDFAHAPVSMSGVFMSTMPALPAEPAGALAKFVPVVPTAVRAFQRLDRVNAFVRVYEAAKNPGVDAVVTLKIVDESGAVAVERHDTLAAARFAASHAVNYRFEAPILSLTRGEYLLSIEASAGSASSRRDIRFTIR